MANYNLVVNSKFQPFSFERYVAPYKMYGEAYKEIENQISELDTQAKVWEKLANDERDKDSDAYKKYKSYSNDLDNLAKSLATEGLNISSRQEALKMKSRYKSDITPIEEAYVKRAKDAEIQAQNELKGIIYNSYASETSLDDYINNPTLKHLAADTTAGYKRVGDAMTALSKQLTSYGPGKHIDPYTKTFLQEHGYKEGEVRQAINDIQAALRGENNTRGAGVLQSILSQEMQTSGVDKWTNKSAVMDYFNRISPAAYQAVGQTSVSPMDDFAARYALQHPTPTISKSLPINPLNIYSKAEQSLEANAAKNFSKYFKRNAKGKYELTEEGQKEYKRKKYESYENLPTTSVGVYTGGTPKSDSQFKKFMDSLGATPDNIGEAWTNWYTTQKRGYDAKKATEFEYEFDQGGTEQENIKAALARGMAFGDESELQEVDFNADKGEFISKGKSLSMEELMDSKTHVLSSRPSAYGTTVIIEREGEKYRYRMPAGINTYNERDRDAAFKEASQIAEILYKESMKKESERKNPYTLSKYNEKYNELIQRGMWHHSQLFGRNKTKETEFERRGY